jgi:nucleoside-diphosphate-sugar epimerase
MKALITGGAGFIGSHLAEALLAHGHRVTALDNLATGSAENVRHLREHPHFRLVVDSALNAELMHCLAGDADVIYHLAAAVGVRWIIDHPLLSIQTNIRATELVLEAAATSGSRVVIASTSEVYGKNTAVPLREDADSIIGSTQITRWLYANSKATDEFLSLAYHRERGVPVIICRFFNTVGPRQTGEYGMVVPRFVEAALRGEPLTVHGDGQQSRCFTDVRDAVAAVMRLVETPAALGEVFNVGSDQETSIDQLARTVLRLTGSKAGLRHVPYEAVYRQGFEDMRRRVPDCSKLRRAVGFAPDTPLEENLLRIIDYSRTRLRAADGSGGWVGGTPLPERDLTSSEGSREAATGKVEPTREILPDTVPALAGGTQ